MRAIENGGKTKQKKKMMCCGEERRGSMILVRLGLVKKRTKK